MTVYEGLLVFGIVVSLICIYFGFRALVTKRKAILGLLITVILVTMFSVGGVITENIVVRNTDSLETGLSVLKNSKIDASQIQNILKELPTEINSNKDFEKIKELILKLEETIENLKVTNTDLKEENNDLIEDMENLKDDLNKLNKKVSSIGVVVGVY